jgi:hypothetical protein
VVWRRPRDTFSKESKNSCQEDSRHWEKILCDCQYIRGGTGEKGLIVSTRLAMAGYAYVHCLIAARNSLLVPSTGPNV